MTRLKDSWHAAFPYCVDTRKMVFQFTAGGEKGIMKLCNANGIMDEQCMEIKMPITGTFFSCIQILAPLLTFC